MQPYLLQVLLLLFKLLWKGQINQECTNIMLIARTTAYTFTL